MLRNSSLSAIFWVAILISSILVPPQVTATAADRPASQPKSSLAPTTAIGILDIPLTDTSIKVDGKCDDSAYASAVSQTFTDGGGSGTVFIVHTATKLIVCMIGTAGTFSNRSGSVYLDPQGDGSTYTYAQKIDYRLQVGITSGTNASFHGTDVADGYLPDVAVPGFWTGSATTDLKNDIVEYEFDLAGFGIGSCGQIFGLAVYHHDVAAAGNSYGMPSNMYYDQPRTWQLMKLVNGPCGVTPIPGPVAYVFRGELTSAVSFYNLLSSAGYGVTLVAFKRCSCHRFRYF